MVTMPGSIGSGSVPVIPLEVEVEVEEVVGAVDDVEPCPGLDAKARFAAPVNRTKSNTNARFRETCLNMGRLLFQRKCALGGD